MRADCLDPEPLACRRDGQPAVFCDSQADRSRPSSEPPSGQRWTCRSRPTSAKTGIKTAAQPLLTVANLPVIQAFTNEPLELVEYFRESLVGKSEGRGGRREDVQEDLLIGTENRHPAAQDRQLHRVTDAAHGPSRAWRPDLASPRSARRKSRRSAGRARRSATRSAETTARSKIASRSIATSPPPSGGAIAAVIGTGVCYPALPSRRRLAASQTCEMAIARAASPAASRAAATSTPRRAFPPDLGAIPTRTLLSRGTPSNRGQCEGIGKVLESELLQRRDRSRLRLGDPLQPTRLDGGTAPVPRIACACAQSAVSFLNLPAVPAPPVSRRGRRSRSS